MRRRSAFAIPYYTKGCFCFMTEIQIGSRLKKRTFYIFLVRTDSLFSRLIAAVTNTKYTHSAIGFSRQCDCLYSFSRLQASTPIPAGFVKESINSGLLSLSPNAPCAVYRVNVTEYVYRDVIRELHQMYLNKSRYTYNYLGPICCFFKLPVKLKNKYFCSQFVAELLARHRVVRLSKPASLYHPRDLAALPELELVYEGKLSELKYSEDVPAVEVLIAANE